MPAGKLIMPRLELEEVSKLYRLGTFLGKKLVAVDGVSFVMEEGQVMSLIGESGSGKTTIGRMILRLIPITSGRIAFDGVDISQLGGRALKDYYRQVQGVFQDPYSSFNPIFKADRVFRIVRQEFFPATGEREWDARVQETLHAVGLAPGEVLNKYPHQLSGGQLQRFLIARALLLDTRFLVADEIISMVDATTRIEVLNLLTEITRDRNLSILFITHDMALGYYISDFVVILHRGRVVERGPIEKVFGNPIHPYTQMLMACVPRLDRKWEQGKERLEVGQGQGLRGCAYYERCPFPYKDCQETKPELIEAESGHFVACRGVGPPRT